MGNIGLSFVGGIVLCPVIFFNLSASKGAVLDRLAEGSESNQAKTVIQKMPRVSPDIDRDDIDSLVIGGINKTSPKKSWWTVSGANCITLNIDGAESFDYKADGFELNVVNDLPEVHKLYGREGKRYGQLKKISYEHVGCGIPLQAQRYVVPWFLDFLTPNGMFSYSSFWIQEYTAEMYGSVLYEGFRPIVGIQDKIIPIEEKDEETRALRIGVQNLREAIREKVKEVRQKRLNRKDESERLGERRVAESHDKVILSDVDEESENRREIDECWSQYTSFLKKNRKLCQIPTHRVDSLMDRIRSNNPYVFDVARDFEYLSQRSKLRQLYHYFIEDLKLIDVVVLTNYQNISGTAIYSFTIEGKVGGMKSHDDLALKQSIAEPLKG